VSLTAPNVPGMIQRRLEYALLAIITIYSQVPSVLQRPLLVRLVLISHQRITLARIVQLAAQVARKLTRLLQGVVLGLEQGQVKGQESQFLVQLVPKTTN
jgi:hypothetical protein